LFTHPQPAQETNQLRDPPVDNSRLRLGRGKSTSQIGRHSYTPGNLRRRELATSARLVLWQNASQPAQDTPRVRAFRSSSRPASVCVEKPAVIGFAIGQRLKT
jgi:hypothetical protein